MVNESKKRWHRKVCLFITVAILSSICLSFMVYTQVPTPHNVIGRVFTNSSNGVQNGIPVFINNTDSDTSVLTAVSAPPIPALRGSYSATIEAFDADAIIGLAWNDTHFGNATTKLLSTTTTLDIILNMTRGSEANVTIFTPDNNTIKNKSIDFNVTANVSMIGADGVNCNATVEFTDTNILNTSPGENATKELGNINRGDHQLFNWSIRGLHVGVANLTVSVVCESDTVYIENVNLKRRSNITIVNAPPEITALQIPDPVDLIAGLNTTVYCNATIFEGNTVSDIATVNATLYNTVFDFDDDNDNNYHYTNSSCMNVSSTQFEATYACGFPVAYYANSGNWACNVTVVDFTNETNISDTTTVVNELLAINIIEGVLDYGNLAVAEISPEDVNATISNIGNLDFNVSVYGYAREEGDNLSMNCTKGNISIEKQHYSILPGQAYADMVNLSSNETLIGNITFPQRTNDLIYGNDTNETYWKLEVPPLVRGQCNGSVVFKTILT